MVEHSPPEHGRKKRDWLSIVGMAAVAGAAAFTSYSGLAGLAEMAGWNHMLAKFLPITVDAYAMTATRVWLSPANLTAKARGFARRSAVGSIIASVAGNALFHAATAHVLAITWPMVVGLSAVPPVTLGLITHLYHTAKDTEPEPKTSPGPAIADPDAVKAAYPILGNPGALNLPSPSGGAPSAPARRSALAPGARPSAPAARPSAPRQAPASATPRAPGQAASPVARNWEEREAQLLPRAREINAREIVADNGPVSARKLAAELHVSQANAGKLVKALTAGPGPTGAGQQVVSAPANAAPGTPAPARLAAAVETREQSQPAPTVVPRDAEVHPAPVPDSGGTGASSALGPVPPGALPPQREPHVEHANGAQTPAP